MRIIDKTPLNRINLKDITNALLNVTDINQLVGDYNTEVRQLLDGHAPMKSKTIIVRPLVPWFDDELKSHMFFACSRIESTCFNRRAHTGRVVHKTRNRLSVPESQNNNLALVHETQRSTSPFFSRTIVHIKGNSLSAI